jgi:hypothetical protein
VSSISSRVRTLLPSTDKIDGTRQRETMEIGNDIDPEYPEHWPKDEDLPGFKSTMNRFHLACHELHLKIMSLLAIALNLDKDYFLPSISRRSHCLRLLHYPPTDRSEGETRIGSHTDFGTVRRGSRVVRNDSPRLTLLRTGHSSLARRNWRTRSDRS